MRPGLGWAEYLREHVGLASLAAQSMAPGSHLVHVSSAAVFGSQPEHVLGASSPAAPELFGSPSYAWAKLSGELAARAIARERGVRVTVLRFPDVYGPGVESVIESLLGLLRRGVCLELSPARLRRHMLHVDLLVRALERLVERGPVEGHPLIVADPFVLTYGEINAAVRARAARARSVTVPVRLDRAVTLLRRWPGFPAKDAPMRLVALAVLGQDNVFDADQGFDVLGLDRRDFSREKTFDAYLGAGT